MSVDKSLLCPVCPPSCLQLILSPLLLFSRWVMSNSLRPCQAPLSFSISQSLLKCMFIELVMPFNHLIHCHPLLLLPSNLSQHQGLFQWVSSLHQVAKVYCLFYYQYPNMFLLRLCTFNCIEFMQSYLCFLQNRVHIKILHNLASAQLSSPDVILHALWCPVTWWWFLSGLYRAFTSFLLLGLVNELLPVPFLLLVKPSVQFRCSVVSDSLRPHESQYARPPCPSPTPGVTQTHVHWVGDAIQPSHPLSSPSPPAPNPSKHQGLFQWVSSSHQVAKVLELNTQLKCLLVCEAFPRPTPADQVTPIVAPSWMCTSACSVSCCDHLIISDQSSSQCYPVRTTDTNCEMFMEQVTLGSLSSHSYLLRYSVGYFWNHIHKIPFSGPQAAGLNRRHQSGASK